MADRKNDDTAYELGYGKPSKATQFRKGRSGNPRGRPKGARRTIWNGIDHDGQRIIDQAFLPQLRRRTSSQEMLIEMVNGSVWQIAGSDDFDSLVGSNPVGLGLHPADHGRE